jgi:hypothetical protein
VKAEKPNEELILHVRRPTVKEETALRVDESEVLIRLRRQNGKGGNSFMGRMMCKIM